MEDFIFDLQRFNEDGADEAAEQLESGDSAEESGQQTEKPEFMLDENGRIVFLHDDEETEDDSEDSDDDEEPAAKSTPGKEQAEATYTPQQLKDMDFEDLDPKKLPAEMLPWYRSMQSGFTRKMQQLSEKEKSLKPAEQPAQQEVRTPDMKEHIQGLSSLAKFQACQLLGIENEDFDRTDDDHEAAYQVALMKINQAVESNVNKERTLINFDTEQAEEDPKYYEMKQWAKDVYINKMPYEDRLGFEVAIQNADVKALKKTYLPMIQKAYNKANGIETDTKSDAPIGEKLKAKARPAKEPPSLETGKGSDKQVSKGFDASQLKGKSLYQQMDLLVKAGYAKP